MIHSGCYIFSNTRPCIQPFVRLCGIRVKVKYGGNQTKKTQNYAVTMGYNLGPKMEGERWWIDGRERHLLFPSVLT